MTHEQEWVVPIVHTQKKKSGEHQWQKVFGTAFFLNNVGSFMTAAHVLQNGFAAVEKEGGELSLACYRSNSDYPDLRPILEWSFARQPYDVAVGCVNSPSLRIGSIGGVGNKLGRWDEVHAIGYPLSAQISSEAVTYSEPRGYRGHVLRSLHERKQVVPNKKHPDSYELDFALPLGMSGAPLVIRNGGSLTVVGVCVGTVPAEVVDYSVVLVEENDKHFSEKHLKVELYGIAHDVTSLVEWTPWCFGGVSLAGIGTPNSRRSF